MTTQAQTPMMMQWHSCKEEAPDTLLFFRLGDFYEAFYEDAEVMAKELDLTLTKRQEIPMAGVPHHICDAYIDRLVAKGYRVAIAEQMENPKETKGIVKRGIVRIVTPGTVINSSLIEDKKQSYLASIFQLNQHFGLSFLDITTASFFATEYESREALLDELCRIQPREIICEKKWKEDKEFFGELKRSFAPTVHPMESWHFAHQSALDSLCKQFQVHTLDGFGLKGMTAAVNAAGALLSYVAEDLSLPVDHIKKILPLEKRGHMTIDKSTYKNLELSELLKQLDQTKTPMGGRLFRHYLYYPLLSPVEIEKRQSRVEGFTKNFSQLLKLRGYMGEIRDLERLIMRIETGFAGPKDLVSLKNSLEPIPLIAPLVIEEFPDCSPLTTKLASALVESPPMRLSDGGLFQEGFDKQLDQLTSIKKESKTWIASYQTRLRETLGIKTLKVGYTKAFGYYIEVSKGQNDKVPAQFHRRQTLVNAERYITDELKEFEYKVLSADEKISALEATLFSALCKEVATYAAAVREIAQKIAQLDVLATLAKVAVENNYVRPTIDDSLVFDVEEGRHPVIERTLEEAFIPNDTFFDGREKQLALITGPNMAGKSTYIRQAALIAIMAQMGSFVPAKRAHIGVFDKVFSRIGASDDLSRGQSTFMVEMTETAHILHNATDRSLVILDEIGRGTSTFDGVAIAWAVAQYLLTTPQKRAKTLFATHYFELAELATLFPGVFNLNVAVDEHEGEIAFLHKIIEGVADKSYGIHVARLAGLPRSALKIAEEKLGKLEPKKKPPKKQLELF